MALPANVVHIDTERIGAVRHRCAGSQVVWVVGVVCKEGVNMKCWNALGAVGLVAVALAPAAAVHADVVTLAPMKDNTLFQHPIGGSSNGAGAGLFVGKTGRGESIRRAVLAFDVAGAVPAGSTITRVDFTLNCNRAAGGSFTINMHRMLGDWGEGASDSGPVAGGGGSDAQPGDATWLFPFFGSPQQWTNAGGDYSPVISAGRAVPGTGVQTWSSTSQMVADVQMWLNTPGQNFGWLLKGPETSAGQARRFATKEEEDVTQRPVLRIEYTVPAPGAMGLLIAGLVPLARRRR